MQNLKDFFQGASNSIASNVSAPVDGIAWLLRKAGVPVPPNPMGGSDWMTEKGLTPQPQNRTAGLLGEAFGLSGPMVAAAKAPQLAKGLLKMGDNLAAPTSMNPQAGKVFVYPQDKALATAQLNAARSLDEGGLGLAANNTPAQRAQAMGFDTEFQHGTKHDIKAFDLSKTQQSDAGYLGQGFYGARLGTNAYADGGAYPLLTKSQGMQEITPANWNINSPYSEMAEKVAAARAKNESANLAAQKYRSGKLDSGIKGIIDKSNNGSAIDQLVVYEPQNIRSRFAAFDPARRNEADILGRADPELLKWIAGGGLLGLGGYNALKE